MTNKKPVKKTRKAHLADKVRKSITDDKALLPKAETPLETAKRIARGLSDSDLVRLYYTVEDELDNRGHPEQD